MNLYTIRRRNAWKTPEELQAAAELAGKAGEEMPNDVRWIRSYVVSEDDGSMGTVCIYQAVSIDAVKQHAQRAGMPADEITAVLDTVIARPDPA